MKKIKVTNWKGQEVQGIWNEKFYDPQVQGNANGIYRIYIDNERVHITEEEKERLISSTFENKVKEDNTRIEMIKKEYSKLDEKAKVALLEFLADDLSLDSAKEIDTTLKARIAMLNRMQ